MVVGDMVGEVVGDRVGDRVGDMVGVMVVLVGEAEGCVALSAYHIITLGLSRPHPLAHSVPCSSFVKARR
jgi:hypothetical protein